MNAAMHPDPPCTTGDEAVAPGHIMSPVAQDMVMPDEASTKHTPRDSVKRSRLK